MIWIVAIIAAALGMALEKRDKLSPAATKLRINIIATMKRGIASGSFKKFVILRFTNEGGTAFVTSFDSFEEAKDYVASHTLKPMWMILDRDKFNEL